MNKWMMGRDLNYKVAQAAGVAPHYKAETNKDSGTFW